MSALLLLKTTAMDFLQTTEYAMSYHQVRFLLFLTVFLAVYFLIVPNTARKFWILLGNVFFCIWSGWAALFLVLGTALIVYFSSLQIEKVYLQYEKDLEGRELRPKEQVAFLAQYKKKAKKHLWFALVLILGLWIYVKIGKFLGMPTVVSFRQWRSGAGIIVPLGISYYTLSVVGYLLDIFWRKTKPVHNFLDLLVVMTYFPHILQGPISKYEKLLPQFARLAKFDYERVCFGLQLMLWGYIKKMVLADRLIVYTQAVFGNLINYGGAEVLLAVLLSGVQLYADFSGCMDIVTGIAQAMGIELDVNFRQPFFSRSASEFWTRWHMTLSAWTKAYIFLPIAMSPGFMKLVRTTKKKRGARMASFLNAFVPLITVWLFTGLWHGTGVDYILWGLYWCALMTISKETDFIWKKVSAVLKLQTDSSYFVFWQCVRTYLCFVIGKCFTAAGGLKGFVMIFGRMFSGARLWVLFDGSLYQHGLDQKDFYVAVFFMIALLIVDLIHEKGVKIRKTIAAYPLVLRWGIYITAILILIVWGVYGPGFDAKSFAYGAF